MFEVFFIAVIVFEKADLINALECVYSHERRQLFLTQNTVSEQVKNKKTTNEKLKCDCMSDKGKTLTNVKSLLFTA